MDSQFAVMISLHDAANSSSDSEQEEYEMVNNNPQRLSRALTKGTTSQQHTSTPRINSKHLASSPTTSPLTSPLNRASRGRSFKRSRFLPRLGSKERFTVLSLEAEEALEALMRIVEDRIKRNNLVHSLLVQKSDASTKVRFLAAVREFEEEKRKVDKKSKGRKIVSLFVQNGSMFQVHNIPPSLEQALLAFKLDALSEFKMLVVNELVLNPMVIDTMRRIGEGF